MNKKIKIIILPKKETTIKTASKIIELGHGTTDSLDVIDELVFNHPELDMEFIREDVGGTLTVLSKASLKNIREMGLDVIQHI